MSWLARQSVDLWRAMAGVYYAVKYRLLAENLGRPPAPPQPDDTRGFIGIQIDGLSYDHLRLALDQGFLPHVRQMLEEGRGQIKTWHCGLPSTTPAVQAGLLYGNNYDIPGFRWYEKERGASFVVKRPDQTRSLARRLSEAGRGLLRGGSSYTNIFDGDAALSLFTLSTVGKFHFFENVRGLGFFLLFLLSPVRVARVLFYSMGEYLRDLGRRVLNLWHPEPEAHSNILAPFYRITVDVVLSEIETFGMMLDIYRGVSNIYTTFSTYDERAHRFGPSHPEALRALRHIDHQIHQLDRMRTLYQRRVYDLYIVSDHGMSPSASFESRYKQTLGQFILSNMGEAPLALDEEGGYEATSSLHAHFLLDEMAAWEERLAPRSTRVVHKARQSLDKRTPAIVEKAALDPERRCDVIVRASGGLAHVYFNVSPQRLKLSEIVWLYPDLLEKLINHPAIGLVAGLEGERPVIINRDGRCVLNGDEIAFCEGDVLRGLESPQTDARALGQLLQYPHCGDLVVFGVWEPDGSVISFEDQLGTHGGLGGPQNRPFIIYPSETPPHPEALASPCDLHAHFLAHYGARSSEE